MIDLQRFCANDSDHRSHLYAPWLHDGWVYATNGHVCVRVLPEHAAPCESATEKHPKAFNLFDKWCADGLGEFGSLPALSELSSCTQCDGKERFNVMKCPDCDEGHFMRGRWTYECQECEDEPVEAGWLTTTKATGKTMACDECYGRGAQMAAVKVGGAIAELIYMTWLAKLPGIKVRPHGPDDALAFTFDGGQALLMPRRR